MRKILVVLALAAVLGACGDDDGSGVNASGASASASASASSGASGSGSGSGTASGAAEKCNVEGGVEDKATDEVHAELTEFKIALDKTTVPAGKIKFDAENAGKDEHEIVIVKADDASRLPTSEDGGADEAGFALVGEIEPFASGSACEGTFELAAGTYAVFCNIVEEEEDGELEAHYKEGMYTSLTVS